MIPFLHLIKALELAKNGRPKMTSTLVLECETGFVSKKMKSTGN
jgi:hypothetical protein